MRILKWLAGAIGAVVVTIAALVLGALLCIPAVVSGVAEHYRGWLAEWRHAELPLAPFHWEIELPEVFERESPRRCSPSPDDALRWRCSVR